MLSYWKIKIARPNGYSWRLLIFFSCARAVVGGKGEGGREWPVNTGEEAGRRGRAERDAGGTLGLRRRVVMQSLI